MTSFRTTYLQVQRTARVLLFGEPSPAVRQVWIACHGYGQLAPKLAGQLTALQARERIIAIPEALNRFYLDDHGGEHGPEHPVGATWMTREERQSEIDDYCRYLDQVHDLAHANMAQQTTVVALGFSQGAATASRWAARTTRRIDHVVLWGAGPASGLDPSPRLFGDASLTIVAGTRDRAVPPDRLARERQRLNDAGLAHTLEQFEGGHRLDDATLLRLGERFG